MSNFDRLTNKILQFLAPKGAECFCSISENWDHESKVPIGQLCNTVNAQRSEVLAAVAYLVEQGLAQYRFLNSSTGHVNIAFRLTHQGLHYKEFRRLTSKERWKERIIGFMSGMAITVIGALILSWIGLS